MSNRLFWAHSWLRASYPIPGTTVHFLHPSGWGSRAERTIPLLSGTHADSSSTHGGQHINLLKHMSKTSSAAHPNAHVHSSHFSRTIKPGPSDVIPAPPWSMDTPKGFASSFSSQRCCRCFCWSANEPAHLATAGWGGPTNAHGEIILFH